MIDIVRYGWDPYRHVGSERVDGELGAHRGLVGLSTQGRAKGEIGV